MSAEENDAEQSYLVPGYFPFPFTPYDIQEQFMRSLYSAIEEKKIGIFESPTGTGKSLSLICGALTWLRDYDQRQQEEIDSLITGENCTNSEQTEGTANQSNEEEPSWVNEYEEKKAQREIIDKMNLRKMQKEKSKTKIDALRKQRQFAAAARNKRKREESSSDASQKTNLSSDNHENETDEDDDLVLKDYHSDLEEKPGSESSSESELEEDDDYGMKIYYCSRTHSQLSQFVSEVKKSPFGKNSKVVALGSRQNYCINNEVQRLRSVNSINERCLELQRSKKEKKLNKEKTKKRKITGCGCPFYQTKKLHEFTDHVFVDVQDIEQLVELGKDLETCPYYGSRFAVPQAQLIVLPYNTLLHKSTRDAVGIKLKDSVIIVDEAHNLIETINSLHSVEISGTHILTSQQQLSQYLNRYRSRLKAKNLMYINQLLSILDTFIKFLSVRDKLKHGKENATKKEDKENSSLHTIDDFVFSAKIDNLNLFKIRRYCERSMIAKKLNGFVDRYFQTVGSLPNGNDNDVSKSSQFFHIEAFLEALTNVNKDGRILVTRNDLLNSCSMKFLLLNPAVHFADVIKEARAVIIAGGTMQPVSEFKQVLLHSAGVSPERITEFSCGHVIPPENLVTIAFCKGPSSLDLDFTYQSRDRHNTIEELGRLLVNICTVVPGGVVCFFPSYDYEETVYTKWQNSGILQRIESRKKIFREPRKSGVDRVLANYSQCVKRCSPLNHSTVKPHQTGAVLLSVVGGKMSEGINFSDDLGRCIVMVGLPYPNINSPELKEKMEYLNKTIGPKAGQQHYENICMKAVNQSIGRAIRHRGDHACICLVDQRYSKPSVQAKLPAWIQSRLQVHPRFGPAFASINKFFADKRAMPCK